MSRKRKPNSTDPRKNTSDSPAAAKRFATAYECGHCQSVVDGVTRDAFGIDHISVVHDDGCPVLAGTLSDVPDTLRAACGVGGVLVILLGDQMGRR